MVSLLGDQQLRLDTQLMPSNPNFVLTEPDPTGTLTQGLNASAGSESAAASGGSGAAGGMMVGMAAFSLGIAVMGIFSTIENFKEQKRQIAFQERMAKNGFAHTEKMGLISKNAAMDNIASTATQQQTIVDGTEKLNRARENRKEAEDGLTIAKAETKEAKLTEKAWKSDTAVLDRYFMGNPTA